MVTWLQRLRTLVGTFWLTVARKNKIVDSVLTVVSALCTLKDNAVMDYLVGRLCKRAKSKRHSTPSVLLVRASSIHRAEADIKDIFNGTKKVGDLADTGKWMFRSGRRLDDVGVISAKVSPTLEPVEEIPSTVDGNVVTLAENPSNTGVQRSEELLGNDSSKPPETVYRFFCWEKESDVRRENVNSILGLPFTGEAADIAWEIHVLGATVYNAKRLLASLTGCVVAVESGTISKIREVGGTTRVSIGDREYVDITGKPCNLSVGDAVEKGDVLFGKLVTYYGGELPSSDVVPSIRVMTDVGELTAENREIDVLGTKFHDEESGLNFLPLSGDEDKVNAYILRCREIARDANAPRVPVPDVVNPALFVLGTLRARRYCCIVVPDASSPLLEDAVRHIRRNTPSGAMLSLIFNTGVEAVALPEVTADAESAVSVEAEASIPDTMSADADSKELV